MTVLTDQERCISSESFASRHCEHSGTYSIQCVSLFSSMAAIVSLLLTSDRKVPPVLGTYLMLYFCFENRTP